MSGRSGEAFGLARRRASAGGRGWSASPLRAAPLRRVTSTRAGPYGAVEVLECGHELRVRRDMVGETVAARRRCGACLALAERGEAIWEVAREDPAARDRRLVARDVGALYLRRCFARGLAATPSVVLTPCNSRAIAMWVPVSVRVGWCRFP